jgi:hypothetical protein
VGRGRGNDLAPRLRTVFPVVRRVLLCRWRARRCSPAAAICDFGILINGFLNLPLSTRFFANAPASRLGGVAILIGYVLAPRTLGRRPFLNGCGVSWLSSRFVIALPVLVPLAYIEGPAALPPWPRAARPPPRLSVTLPAIGRARLPAQGH